MTTIYPARHHPVLPIERFILPETPNPEAIPLDVLFVGAGPAGLAGAIELARLVAADEEIDSLEIAVLEKAAAGRALPVGRGRQPARVPGVVSRMPSRISLSGQAVQEERSTSSPTARSFQFRHRPPCESRQLRRIDLRDRALAGRKGGRASGVNVFTGLSRPIPCWWMVNAWWACARRRPASIATGASRQRRTNHHRSRRQGHRARGRHARHAHRPASGRDVPPQTRRSSRSVSRRSGRPSGRSTA